MKTHGCEVRRHTSAFRDFLSSFKLCRRAEARLDAIDRPVTAALKRGTTLLLGALLAAVVFCGSLFAAPAGSPAARKQQARTQFETAERTREALNGRLESERTRKEYQKVADAYRKVYYVAPASSKADSTWPAGSATARPTWSAASAAASGTWSKGRAADYRTSSTG